MSEDLADRINVACDKLQKASPEALSIIEAVLDERYLDAWKMLLELPSEIKRRDKSNLNLIQDATCPDCGGTGGVVWEIISGIENKKECPTCKGTGEVSE